jgi:sporulation protein YlmC with PRC-barrel domain
MIRAPIFAAIGVLLALSAAYAQQPQKDAPANTPVSTSIPGADEASLAGSARASKLIGSSVYKGDTSIGAIEDILVDLDHGSLKAFVLSVGGFLGIGNKLVAIPISQIKLGTEAKFTTELTKEQLTNAPAFDPSKLK